MSLLAIIITLGIERFYAVLDEYRNLEWFARWGNWVEEHRTVNTPRGGGFTSLLTLLIPVLLAHQLGGWMADGGWLPELLFNVLVLIVSLGPRDLRNQVEAVLESWSREDIEGGILHAEGLLEGGIPDTERGVVRKLTEAVLTEANPRIFTVLFWFVLFGPAAALLIRLALMLEMLQQDEDEQFGTNWLVQLNQLLAWPSAHLVALTYALVGDFAAAFRQIMRRAGDWRQNCAVMSLSGMGAIQLEPVDERDQSDADLQEVWDALEMVRRAEMAWMVLLALLVLNELL